jgi:hypothetical protein
MAPDNEAMRTTQIEWHPATKLPDHCSEVLVLLKDQQTSRVGHFDEHWYITEMRHHRAVSGVVMWAEMPEAPTPLDRATELESGSLEAQSAADIELASKCRYVGEMPNGVRVTFDRGVIYVGSTRMGAYGHGVPYMSKDWPRPTYSEGHDVGLPGLSGKWHQHCRNTRQGRVRRHRGIDAQTTGTPRWLNHLDCQAVKSTSG